jgi:hypothetical protein
VNNKLTAQDWYDIADLFGQCASGALMSSNDSDSINSKAAGQYVSKKLEDMAYKAHCRAKVLEQGH